MSIKHVVFDWDGTLADTFSVISAAYNYTFDKLNLPRIPYDEIKRITSTLQNKDTLECIFGERKNEASQAYYEFIKKHHASNLEPIKNAQKVLDFCQKSGLKLYLITNKKRLYLKEEITKLGFDKYFKKIIAAGEFAEDKPSPIACHAIFDNFIPEADSILVIGDGEADVKTAKAYNHGVKSAKSIIYDPLNKYNGQEPNYKVTDLIEIIDLIKKDI